MCLYVSQKDSEALLSELDQGPVLFWKRLRWLNGSVVTGVRRHPVEVDEEYFYTAGEPQACRYSSEMNGTFVSMGAIHVWKVGAWGYSQTIHPLDKKPIRARDSRMVSVRCRGFIEDFVGAAEMTAAFRRIQFSKVDLEEVLGWRSTW